MAQQTAVQRLVEYITKHGFDLEYEMELSFLEWEKEQIMDAYTEGCADSILDESTDKVRSEQYYNETFNKG